MVQNISPAPREELESGRSKSSKILRARESCEGARHGFDCDSGVLERFLARLASGSRADGDKGRLAPDDADVCPFST